MVFPSQSYPPSLSDCVQKRSEARNPESRVSIGIKPQCVSTEFPNALMSQCHSAQNLILMCLAYALTGVSRLRVLSPGARGHLAVFRHRFGPIARIEFLHDPLHMRLHRVTR